MDPQHGGQWIRGSAALLTGLEVVGLNQIEKGLPRHHLHVREKPLPFDLLLGGGELVIGGAELLATHHPSPGLRLQNHCPANGAGFPESP